jgi:hypothetical protein
MSSAVKFSADVRPQNDLQLLVCFSDWNGQHQLVRLHLHHLISTLHSPCTHRELINLLLPSSLDDLVPDVLSGPRRTYLLLLLGLRVNLREEYLSI